MGITLVDINGKLGLYKDGKVYKFNEINYLAYCYYESDGFIKVKNEDTSLFNWINTDTMEYLSKDWYEDISIFTEGYAIVYNNKKYNIINNKGKLISKEWFDGLYWEMDDIDEGDIEIFNKGNLIVHNIIDSERLYNIIDKDGNLLFDTYYPKIKYSNENGFFIIGIYGEDNKLYDNIIDKDGKLMLDIKNTYSISYSDNVFVNNCFVIKDYLRNKENLLNLQGSFVSEKWFNKCTPITKNYAIVESFIDGKKMCNLLDINTGNLLDKWYKNIYHTDDGNFLLQDEDYTINVANINECSKKYSDYKFIFDIDGTICKIKDKDEKYEDLVPNKRMLDIIKKYKENGATICLYTSRNMNTYQNNIGKINANTAITLYKWLDKWGIPYDEIIFGKPWPGKKGLYIDDRTVRPKEFIEKPLPYLECICKFDKIYE